MKKVSMIIPVYNGEKFLENCFFVLESQTIGMEYMECIFVNDASTDNGKSWEMLCDFERKYPESVVIIDSKENHRVGGSRNIGLNYATGRAIGFMDQDDILHPCMLENMYQFMMQYHCDVVMCRYWKVDKPEVYPIKRLREDYIIDIQDDKEREKLLAVNQLGYLVWDKLYDRELIQKNHIHFPDGKFFEDTYFSGLVCGYTKRVGMINETYYFYYQHSDSTNESMSEQARKDLLDVNNQKWDEFVKRGIYNQCKMAVEYDYIRNYFLGGIQNFMKVYEKIPYSLFLNMQKDVRCRINKQDYLDNSYLQKGLNEWEKCLLQLVWCEVDETVWDGFCLIGKEM